MSGSIPAGNLQRTGEYHTHRVSTFHEVYWTFPFSGEIEFPVLQDRALYTVDRDGVCYAIDAQTGTLRWKVSVGDTSSMEDVLSIALNERTAFVSTGPFVFGLDLQTGQETWRVHVSEITNEENTAVGQILIIGHFPTGLVLV
ncbi:MAG TPA: PQQ-binding-like beta-propeller repeat protein [Ktedonobacteraceae bacterium]|nr:PQQ-binding-like beta-propeller repeat protein [Ktedonobacteraceae bacterium]